MAQPVDSKRVVFMGDSITDFWRLDQSFPGKPYVNRGIGGQTTPQMLVRMYPDVIDLKSAAMIVLAGTNDIARNTGPMDGRTDRRKHYGDDGTGAASRDQSDSLLGAAGQRLSLS